jgi:hypothetical protein
MQSLICDWLVGLDVLVMTSQERILLQVGGMDMHRS